MIGLLKERFYCTAESNKLYFGFLAVLAVIVLFTGNSILLYGYALFSLPGFAFISVAGLRKESVTNWNKYKLTFPVRRSIIVDSFYISHAILIVLGMIFTMLVFALTVLIHGNHYFDFGVRDAVSILTFFGIVAFFVGATFCPLFYYCGTEKADVLLIISLITSVGFAVLLVWLLNYLNDFQIVSNSRYYINLMFMWLTALIAFLVSRFCANYIYQKVEY